MPRRPPNPKIRAAVMQIVLIGVFAVTVGLAALVTRHVRASMRVEMGEPRAVGRLTVRLPAKWLSSPLPLEKGDAIEAEEPPGEQAGRRLRVLRNRTAGLISPLEHLSRSGLLKPDVLKAIADGREGFSVRSVRVGGWPGQIVTASASPRAGVIHKDVIACATLPGSEAVVIALEGLGPPDASDQELVRQVCQTVSMPGRPQIGVAAPKGPVELVDQIAVAAPPRFLEVRGDDEHELQRQLVSDGSAGGWVAIDLTSCVFFADDREEALLAMLAARDPDWRSGPVKQVGPRTWVVDRAIDAGAGGAATAFPSRAYLTAHADGRALLVVMRGSGPRDGRAFDAAWQAIASSVDFRGTKDLSSLLANGADAARRVAGGRLVELLKEEHDGRDHGAKDWYVWDASANAGQERWSEVTWRATTAAATPDGAWSSLAGTRATYPTDPYQAESRFEQQWSAAADLSTYQVTTSREVVRGAAGAPGGGARSRPRFEQRVSVDRGRMTLAVDVGTSLPDVAAPPQYVPGAVVPLVMRELGERPSLIRTESFVGGRAHPVAPAGLLTLLVTRLADVAPRLDDQGEPMECVTVGVNGTGVVSRWYYSTGPQTGRRELRFIDFPGGLKAAAE